MDKAYGLAAQQILSSLKDGGSCLVVPTKAIGLKDCLKRLIWLKIAIMELSGIRTLLKKP